MPLWRPAVAGRSEFRPRFGQRVDPLFLLYPAFDRFNKVFKLERPVVPMAVDIEGRGAVDAAANAATEVFTHTWFKLLSLKGAAKFRRR